MPHEVGIESDEQPARDHLVHQIRGGQEEAEEHRQRAGGGCGEGGASGQHDRGGRLRAAARHVEAPVAPAVAFEPYETCNGKKHHAGDLRGAGQARAVEPGGEDRERQRAHAEILGGADVVERFEQRERQADRERGARERQRDVTRQHQPRGAERARDLEQRGALRLEHRARHEEDVRVEHDRKDEDRARQRAHVRIPAERCPPLAQRTMPCTGPSASQMST